MTGLRRIFGFVGAMVGTALPIAGAIAAVSPMRGCRWEGCTPGSTAVFSFLHGASGGSRGRLRWRPWIDDPDGERAFGDPPHCRSGRRDGIVPVLDEAPLPGAFDPEWTPRELYACILVAPDGRAAAVRLLGSSGRSAVDAMLRATILDGWRFIAGSSRPEWVRVLLSREIEL